MVEVGQLAVYAVSVLIGIKLQNFHIIWKNEKSSPMKACRKQICVNSGASWRDKFSSLISEIEKQLDAAVSCIWSRFMGAQRHPQFNEDTGQSNWLCNLVIVCFLKLGIFFLFLPYQGELKKKSISLYFYEIICFQNDFLEYENSQGNLFPLKPGNIVFLPPSHFFFSPSLLSFTFYI